MVFSHGWRLSADAWEDQMDTYANDLAMLVDTLDLEDAIYVGHSTGGGEVARYIGRHGTQRVAKAVLIGAGPPLMLKTDVNPGGLPIEVFDQIRAGVLADRSQFFQDLTMPFYGANRPHAKVSQGLRDDFYFWRQGMQVGFKGVIDCIKVFSETGFTKDLKQFDVPTLILLFTSLLRLTAASSASVASRRCTSGGTRTINRPLNDFVDSGSGTDSPFLIMSSTVASTTFRIPFKAAV